LIKFLYNYSEVRPFHCKMADIIRAKLSVFDLTQPNLSDVDSEAV